MGLRQEGWKGRGRKNLRTEEETKKEVNKDWETKK